MLGDGHHRKSGDYRGYDLRLSTEIDDELVRVGRGTPCGEYLRRFWHPFFLMLSMQLLDIYVGLMKNVCSHYVEVD